MINMSCFFVAPRRRDSTSKWRRRSKRRKRRRSKRRNERRKGIPEGISLEELVDEYLGGRHPPRRLEGEEEEEAAEDEQEEKEGEKEEEEDKKKVDIHSLRGRHESRRLKKMLVIGGQN